MKKKWAVLVLPFFSFCFGMQDEPNNLKDYWLQFCGNTIEKAELTKKECYAFPQVQTRYIELSGSLFKDKTRQFTGFDKPCLRTIHNAGENDKHNLRIVHMKAWLAGEYKIHLMPADAQEMRETLQDLIGLLKRNKEFQDLMYGMKFHSGIKGDMSDEYIRQQFKSSAGHMLPFVVLYPARGKDSAQKVLDILYGQFSNKKGLGVTPRFNQKFTDFLYAAQGEGSYKASNYSCYFEQPECIYYRPDFEGNAKDYRLQPPTQESERKKLKKESPAKF